MELETEAEALWPQQADAEALRMAMPMQSAGGQPMLSSASVRNGCLMDPTGGPGR